MVGRLGKTGARFAKGAADGAVGAAAVEPLVALQARSEQADYSAMDSLLNIAFGGVLGGGLHVGLGKLDDWLHPEAIEGLRKGKGLSDAVLAKEDAVFALEPQKDAAASFLDDLAPGQHEAALRGAIAALAEGRPVDVGFAIEAERQALARAYDVVKAQPMGPADDPLVHISPEDIEAVAIGRGGWKGLGDIEIKPRESGWGLVKFIWRHGEKSKKPQELSVMRDDILAFPQIIREYDKLKGYDPRWRLWTVDRSDGQRVLYVDKLFDEIGKRHMVTIHVLKDKNSQPLSTKKNAGVSESGGRTFLGPSADTTGVPFAQQNQGQNTPAPPTISSSGRFDKDAMAQAARDIVDRQRQVRAYPEDLRAAAEVAEKTKGYDLPRSYMG